MPLLRTLWIQKHLVVFHHRHSEDGVILKKAASISFSLENSENSTIVNEVLLLKKRKLEIQIRRELMGLVVLYVVFAVLIYLAVMSALDYIQINCFPSILL
jgi:hypothetical protein